MRVEKIKISDFGFDTLQIEYSCLQHGLFILSLSIKR